MEPSKVYFPEGGVRVSEDTATLLSPEMIEEHNTAIYKEKHTTIWRWVPLHFSGEHPTIFDQFTSLPEIKAIDLGNPEKYNTKKLMERCAETGNCSL